MARCSRRSNIDTKTSSPGIEGHGGIHVAACAMVFAERYSNAFLSHDEIDYLVNVGGRAVLRALVSFEF